MRIPARQLVAIFAVLLWLSPGLCGAGALPGGTAISNTVSATFADATDRNYAITSNIVTATIAKLAALVVTPKETQANSTTDGVAVGQNATRTFAITNTSNIADAYRVTSLTTGALRLVSAEFVTPAGAPIGPATSSVSPAVQPGGSVDVVVVASTAGLSVGQSIPIQLTAETTATGTNNGLQSDTGEQWVVTATGPQLHGPSGPNAPVLKSVDGSTIVQAQPGGSVTFDIVAVNGGGSPATNVVVSDQLPTGLATTASTVNIDGTPAGAAAALSGQMLTVRVPALAAGATLDVSFVATVLQGDAVGQTIVNVASISADGIAAQNTTPASVLLGTADEVYSGLAGQKAPVAGATVTLLAANGQLPALQASAVRGASGSANANAQDPLITGPSGLYGFALSPSAIAASGSQFYLTIAAPGYLNRKIALTILPTLGASLYDVTAKALDGQPLAVAGGYALTTKAVTLDDVVGLFGNVPLFASRTIVVSKSVDRQIAQPGDRLLYTVTFSNATNAPVGVTTVADTLRRGSCTEPGAGGSTVLRPNRRFEGASSPGPCRLSRPARTIRLNMRRSSIRRSPMARSSTTRRSSTQLSPERLRHSPEVRPPACASSPVRFRSGALSSGESSSTRCAPGDSHAAIRVSRACASFSKTGRRPSPMRRAATRFPACGPACTSCVWTQARCRRTRGPTAARA